MTDATPPPKRPTEQNPAEHELTGAGPDGAARDGAARHDPAQPDLAQHDLSEHDPTGTELAAQIARLARGGSPRQRRKKRSGDVAPPTLSGAGADPRDPKPAQDVLDRLLVSRGWETEVNVHTVIGRWPDLVGSEIADHATPETFDDGVLVVRTDATAWAIQLRSLAPQLLARLNDAVGQQSISRIEIRGPDAPSWVKGRRRVKGAGPGDTYG